MEFDLILHGKYEFTQNTNNKKYNILKIDSVNKIELMNIIFNHFIDNQNKSIHEKHFIGIDFEFNKIRKGERDVALMQINLENNSYMS